MQSEGLSIKLSLQGKKKAYRLIHPSKKRGEKAHRLPTSDIEDILEKLHGA